MSRKTKFGIDTILPRGSPCLNPPTSRPSNHLGQNYGATVKNFPAELNSWEDDMKEEINSKTNPNVRWYESQIVNLYSRSLFLRQDEIRELQYTAQLVDQYAARHFNAKTLQNGTLPLSNRLLRSIIERVREKQAKRPDDAEGLAKLRRKALEYRAMIVRSPAIVRAIRSLFTDHVQKRHAEIEKEFVQNAINRAEKRLVVTKKIVTLLLSDARQDDSACSQDERLIEIRKEVLKKLLLMEKKRFLQDRLTKLVSDKRVMEARGL